MALAKESSVVFSVKQLLDAEIERLNSEETARAELLARDREQQLMAREAEREKERQRAEQAREEERRLQSLHEAEMLKLRLIAENEAAMARMQSETQHEVQLASLQRDARVKSLEGRQRMLLAALATLVTGVALCWFEVIEPGHRRANEAYSQLRQTHDTMLSDAQKREAELKREQRLLRDKLESMPKVSVPVQQGTGPAIPEQLPLKRIPRQLTDPGKHSCDCLPTDPLCDCER